MLHDVVAKYGDRPRPRHARRRRLEMDHVRRVRRARRAGPRRAGRARRRSRRSPRRHQQQPPRVGRRRLRRVHARRRLGPHVRVAARRRLAVHPRGLRRASVCFVSGDAIAKRVRGFAGQLPQARSMSSISTRRATMGSLRFMRAGESRDVAAITPDAAGRRALHLHVGHDRQAQGRAPVTRQPGRQRLRLPGGRAHRRLAPLAGVFALGARLRRLGRAARHDLDRRVARHLRASASASSSTSARSSRRCSSRCRRSGTASTPACRPTSPRSPS